MYGFTRALDTIMSIQNAMEQAMEASMNENTTFHRGVFPPVNILEKNDKLQVICELPGVESENLALEVKGRNLRISGERNINYEDGASLHRIERTSGNFDRTIALPYEVDSSKTAADFKDGLLTITLPKAESEKARKIEIQ